MNRMAVPLDHDPIESDHDLVSLFEHDLFGKPVPTHRVVARGHAFPDHAVAPCHRHSDVGRPVRNSPSAILPLSTGPPRFCKDVSWLTDEEPLSMQFVRV